MILPTARMSLPLKCLLASQELCSMYINE